MIQFRNIFVNSQKRTRKISNLSNPVKSYRKIKI